MADVKKRKTQVIRRSSSSPHAGMLAVVLWSHVLNMLLSGWLHGHPYEASYRFGIEI